MDAYGGLSITPAYCTYIDGTTLNNHAAATWQFMPGGTTDLPQLAGAVINNLAGATFTVDRPGRAATTRSSAQDGSAVAFNNAGTFIVSASSGTSVGMSPSPTPARSTCSKR